MKLMIASDLHGSAHYVKKFLDRYRAEAPDRLLLLGDLLYHGPRNPLPQDYDCPAVADALNAVRDRLLTVRGTCDCEVDQMLLHFPILADYALLEVNGLTLYATHGHLFGPDHLPEMAGPYVLLSGHTHVPMCEQRGEALCLNPGSVSIPKGGSVGSYVVLEGKTFSWKNLEGEVYQSHTVE